MQKYLWPCMLFRLQMPLSWSTPQDGGDTQYVTAGCTRLQHTFTLHTCHMVPVCAIGMKCRAGLQPQQYGLNPRLKQEHARVLVEPLPEISTSVELDNKNIIDNFRERTSHWSCSFSSKCLHMKRTCMCVLMVSRVLDWGGGLQVFWAIFPRKTCSRHPAAPQAPLST